MFDFTKDENVQEYIKAAEAGDINAQYYLGMCFEDGDIVDQSLAKSLYWYEKAAEQGMADAQYATGRMYFGNCEVDADYQKAISWLVKASEKGCKSAKKYLKKLKKQ